MPLFGINLGEVITDRGTVWGPGVNLAQRVEQLAPPGGVAISDTVFNSISKSLPVDYTDLGQQQVKESSIRAYVARPRPGKDIQPVAHEATKVTNNTLLKNKPSVSQPGHGYPQLILMSSCGQLGEMEKAQQAFIRLRRHVQGVSLTAGDIVQVFSLDEDHDRLLDGLDKPGVLHGDIPQ